MNGNEIAKREFEEFIKNASTQEISEYIVESIQYGDTSKNIHIDNLKRIELLAKRDKISFSKESINIALELLDNNKRRAKIQAYMQRRNTRAFLKSLRQNGRE
ncbi:MAG: hypothetical protein IKV03_05975 [Alphaproteobacteria bacterium]|nr:hypothetical protein [Alphaproteobacteria bacterium]